MKRPLLEGLKKYHEEKILRFHMPGHYGHLLEGYEELREMLFAFDVTEVPGLDDLGDPSGILKESMESIAAVYGAKRSYFLVNGSTSGIHVAIESLVPDGGMLLLARNSHKSVINIARKKNLDLCFVYPCMDEVFGVDSHITLDEVRKAVASSERKPDAAILTYPNYYGRAYDLEAIHAYLQSMGISLIVDSAHGASFAFSPEMPTSAMPHCEVCIHSLHKTMPAFTQTSLLHVSGSLSEEKRQKIEEELCIYLSSSPSYLLMASAELSVALMDERGRAEFARLHRTMARAVTILGEQEDIFVYQSEMPKDPCKLFIKTPFEGVRLSEILRRDHKIQCEMTIGDMILFMVGIVHTDEDIERLVDAVIDSVEKLTKEERGREDLGEEDRFLHGPRSILLPRMKRLQNAQIAELEKRMGSLCESPANKDRTFSDVQVKEDLSTKAAVVVEEVDAENSAGRILAEDIIPYPPGIPVMMRYEILDEDSVNLLRYFRINKVRCFLFLDRSDRIADRS